MTVICFSNSSQSLVHELIIVCMKPDIYRMRTRAQLLLKFLWRKAWLSPNRRKAAGTMRRSRGIKYLHSISQLPCDYNPLMQDTILEFVSDSALSSRLKGHFSVPVQ